MRTQSVASPGHVEIDESAAARSLGRCNARLGQHPWRRVLAASRRRWQTCGVRILMRRAERLEQVFGRKPEKRLADSHKIDVIQQKSTTRHNIFPTHSFVVRQAKCKRNKIIAHTNPSVTAACDTTCASDGAAARGLRTVLIQLGECRLPLYAGASGAFAVPPGASRSSATSDWQLTQFKSVSEFRNIFLFL